MIYYVVLFLVIWLALTELQAFESFCLTPNSMFHHSKLGFVVFRTNYGRLLTNRFQRKSSLSDSNMGGDTIDISKSRRRIVFLGTPSVAADCCLQILSDNAFPNLAKSEYEIVAVVTQPPAPAGNNIISNLIIDIYLIIQIMKEEIRN